MVCNKWPNESLSLLSRVISFSGCYLICLELANLLISAKLQTCCDHLLNAVFTHLKAKIKAKILYKIVICFSKNMKYNIWCSIKSCFRCSEVSLFIQGFKTHFLYYFAPRIFLFPLHPAYQLELIFISRWFMPTCFSGISPYSDGEQCTDLPPSLHPEAGRFGCRKCNTVAKWWRI